MKLEIKSFCKKFWKPVTIVVSVATIATVAITSTFAYLTSTPDSITNVFTVGKVAISIEETTGDTYKMIPGNVYDKDPCITVEDGSEDCWLFVKVEENNNTAPNGSYINYEVNSNDWTLVPGETNVYYYAGNDATATEGTKSYVLKDSKVKIDENNVTSEYVATLDSEEKYPKLIFTAYAIQKANIDTVDKAWAQFDNGSDE